MVQIELLSAEEAKSLLPEVSPELQQAINSAPSLGMDWLPVPKYQTSKMTQKLDARMKQRSTSPSILAPIHRASLAPSPLLHDLWFRNNHLGVFAFVEVPYWGGVGRGEGGGGVGRRQHSPSQPFPQAFGRSSSGQDSKGKGSDEVKGSSDDQVNKNAASSGKGN